MPPLSILLPGRAAQRRYVRLQLLARIRCAGVIFFACLVLIGWALDLESCKRIVPGLIAMNPATAVTFIIVGASLWLQATDQRTGGAELMPRTLAAVTR